MRTRLIGRSGLVILTGALIIAWSGLACSRKHGHYVDNIVEGDFEVENLEYRHFDFEVEDDMSNIWLFGYFTAEGGSGDDIEVRISGPKGDIYSSGQVHTDSFDLNLTEPGDYKVIYSNAFSLISHKMVTSCVDMEYDIR
jgi:hypothetical protein